MPYRLVFAATAICGALCAPSRAQAPADVLQPVAIDSYQVIARIDGQVVLGSEVLWQVDEMVPGYEDMLALSVPGSVLEAGDFEIRVEGWRHDWPATHEYDRVNTLTLRVSDK